MSFGYHICDHPIAIQRQNGDPQRSLKSTRPQGNYTRASGTSHLANRMSIPETGQQDGRRLEKAFGRPGGKQRAGLVASRDLANEWNIVYDRSCEYVTTSKARQGKAGWLAGELRNWTKVIAKAAWQLIELGTLQLTCRQREVFFHSPERETKI